MDKEGWITLIRRSLGVPDLIGPEAAERYMGDWVMRNVHPDMVAVDFEDTERWRAATLSVIEDIATAGSEGELDELLVGLIYADFDSTSTKVTNASPYRSHATLEATKHLLECIEQFVATHRFQAGCGCYFT
jgi:hypothetical protein